VGPQLDVTPPTAVITSPASNSLAGGSLTVTASASDDYAVTKVEFYDGSTPIGTDTVAPYSASFATAGTPDGTHWLTVKAYDSAGLVTTSAPVSVIIDNSPPTLSVSSPVHAARLRGIVQMAATASDNQAVTRVDFYDGTQLISSDTTAPYSASWDTTGEFDGYHAIYVRAYDAVGNVQQVYAGVTLDNAGPTVAITSPTNGAAVSMSTTIQATASDHGAVTQVAFYDGSKLLGTDTTAPYSYSWSLLLVSKGQHTLTARATDSVGNVTTSAPVVVTVQ
jgi:hypothetical protein